MCSTLGPPPPKQVKVQINGEGHGNTADRTLVERRAHSVGNLEPWNKSSKETHLNSFPRSSGNRNGQG